MVVLAVASVGIWMVAYAGSGGTAASATASPTPGVLTAAVRADGLPVGPASAWRVTRSDRGRYELEFARPMHLVVADWERTATVVLRPITERRWLVEFIDGHRAVDSRFAFTAAPLP